MDTSVDIVIVNWNAGQLLQECLGSIANCAKDGIDLQRVVVVDNGSTDGSLECARKIQLPLIVLQNPENIGFGAACNQGSLGSKSKYLLFLNPDTRLFDRSLTNSVAFLKDPANSQVDVLGIQMVDENGNIVRTCCTFPTVGKFMAGILGFNRLFPGVFKTHLMSDWDHRESRNVDHVIGAFYLVRTEIFRRLGGFDERFFVYLEDIDFSLRIRQAGSLVYYFAGAQAFHRGGGTSHQVRDVRLFYSLESRMLYVLKHFNRLGAIVVCVGTLVVEPFTRIAAAIYSLSFQTVVETTRALYWTWRALPSTLHGGRRAAP